MVQRRSRMHRTRTAKPLALTARDVEIFATLRRYRFLRSTYLHRFVGGDSEKRFKERLGDLFHKGYLDRPAEQWRFADARFSPVVHELGSGGIESAAGAEPITWLREGPNRQFEHARMTCEILASVELACRDRSDLRFIAWPEILARAPEATRHSARPYLLGSEREGVVPDAIFGIEYQKGERKAFRFFALEVDRGTMPIARARNVGTSVLAKLETYFAILAKDGHRARLGKPNLLVLTVATDRSRCTEIIRRFGERVGEAPHFLFRTIVGKGALSRPSPGLLTEPWERSGLSPLSIDQ